MEQQEGTLREEKNNLGSIRISEEVVSVIAGLAATQVPGVAGMSGGVVGGLTEKLGRKNLTKGVKVEVGEKEAAVDLYIVVDFGSRIPEVAGKIQDAVKQAIEKMTGLLVVEVNVNVQGVAFAQETEVEENRVK
ncbi:Uncharacterized conserved protein YloU, alkaline shock protein (Asp23) family [Desulfotomaculum arcticum]|uniref:Uncharacterized conserved protein YloU, alkaline shock protein (Asp23) family n=1 Tax=Desulfotruncus arcticus DSM 17038 TaxID=1121424 RepID=A0A1I2MWJ0_9FIRM|nr:Asp23/Gls24 family envelope stress response protein [Desulfotruncus arcticus]SFF93501.1 Uncharacterized conserved protein YloU, alkaline shock protein (Asp23) family [Desulfotomaculum arcticum] [Desulfotruncus arcticus DSM 17038]